MIGLLNLTELILASLLLKPISSNSVGGEDDQAESDVESDSEDEKGVAVRVRRKNAMRRREDTRNTASPGLGFDEEGEPAMDRESRGQVNFRRKVPGAEMPTTREGRLIGEFFFPLSKF